MGYRCCLKEKHIWVNSKPHPHHSLLSTKSEQKYLSGYACGTLKIKRQSPIKTRILQVSAMKNEAVNKSFNLIRSRKTLIPLFSPVPLCKFAINMLGEPRERG